METVGMELFQGTHRSVSDHPLGCCFFWELQTCFSLSSGCQAAGFYSYHDWEAIDFEAYHVAGERAAPSLKCHRAHDSYQDLAIFLE